MEFTLSFDQTNFMECGPPPQNDSSHYPNGGWKYHQEMTDYEQSTQWGYALGPQNDQADYMGYCPPPNDSCHYANAFNHPYSTYQETSSLESTFNAFMQNCPTSPPSFSFENPSSLDCSTHLTNHKIHFTIQKTHFNIH
ncbi:hypothetical protein AHAS_Ahas15G0230500 [Arachis hypogaea]